MARARWTNGKVWLGLLSSLIFLFLVFRNVQWAELAAVLHTVNWAILILAAALYALSLGVRGLCWQALLAPLGPVTTKEAVTYANIGYMANSLLPLRAGEVIRAALLAQKRRLARSAVLATIVLERLLDILILGALAMLLALVTPIPAIVRQSILVMSLLGCLGLISVWAVAGGSLTNFSEGRLPQWLPRRATIMVARLARSFAHGLSVVRSKQTAVAACFLLLAWALVWGSTYLMMVACGLRLPWYAALLVMVVVNLGSAIPSSPGSIGVVHFLAVVAVSPWAVNQELAVGFSIVFHALSITVTVVLGGACLLKEKLEVVRVNKASLEAAP